MKLEFLIFDKIKLPYLPGQCALALPLCTPNFDFRKWFSTFLLPSVLSRDLTGNQLTSHILLWVNTMDDIDYVIQRVGRRYRQNLVNIDQSNTFGKPIEQSISLLSILICIRISEVVIDVFECIGVHKHQDINKIVQ